MAAEPHPPIQRECSGLTINQRFTSRTARRGERAASLRSAAEHLSHAAFIPPGDTTMNRKLRRLTLSAIAAATLGIPFASQMSAHPAEPLKVGFPLKLPTQPSSIH